MKRNILEILEETAERFPNKIIYEDINRKSTYQEFINTKKGEYRFRVFSFYFFRCIYLSRNAQRLVLSTQDRNPQDLPRLAESTCSWQHRPSDEYRNNYLTCIQKTCRAYGR